MNGKLHGYRGRLILRDVPVGSAVTILPWVRANIAARRHLKRSAVTLDEAGEAIVLVAEVQHFDREHAAAWLESDFGQVATGVIWDGDKVTIEVAEIHELP